MSALLSQFAIVYVNAYVLQIYRTHWIHSWLWGTGLFMLRDVCMIIVPYEFYKPYCCWCLVRLRKLWGKKCHGVIKISALRMQV